MQLVFRPAMTGLALLLLLSTGCVTSPSVEAQKAIKRGDIDAMLDNLNSNDEWILEDTCRALVYSPQPEAAVRLLEILNTPESGPYARGQAARALAALKDPTYVPELIRAYERAGNSEERYWIMVGIAAFCTEATLGLMESEQFDADLFVSRLAMGGLARCKPPLAEGKK